MREAKTYRDQCQHSREHGGERRTTPDSRIEIAQNANDERTNCTDDVRPAEDVAVCKFVRRITGTSRTSGNDESQGLNI